MLQHLRACDGALLIDMPDDKAGEALGFCALHQGHCTILHLTDAARTAGKIAVEHGLDRVDDHNVGLQLIDALQNIIEICLGKNEDIALVHTEPLRAQLQLAGALLPCHIENLLLPQISADLQQKRRFADARRTADQHQRADDGAAAEDAVKLADACGKADLLPAVKLCDAFRTVFRCGAASFGSAGFAFRLRCGRRFHKRVPAAACRTLTEPLPCFVAAFRAEKNGFLFHLACPPEKSGNGCDKLKIRSAQHDGDL